MAIMKTAGKSRRFHGVCDAGMDASVGLQSCA